jgi:hypothetical protein
MEVTLPQLSHSLSKIRWKECLGQITLGLEVPAQPLQLLGVGLTLLHGTTLTGNQAGLKVNLTGIV